MKKINADIAYRGISKNGCRDGVNMIMSRQAPVTYNIPLACKPHHQVFAVCPALMDLYHSVRQEENTYSTTVRAAKERFTTTGGKALSMIQQEELWRDAEETHGDFFAYAKAVWGYEKSHVYLLLDSVKIREAISSPEAHLNTSHLKILGPALRKDGPEIVQRAWEEADMATGGAITGPALTKALTAARATRTAGTPTPQTNDTAPDSSPSSV